MNSELLISYNRFCVIDLKEDTLFFIPRKHIKGYLSDFCKANDISLHNQTVDVLISSLNQKANISISKNLRLYTDMMIHNCHLLIIDTFRQNEVNDSVLSFALARQRDFKINTLLK